MKLTVRQFRASIKDAFDAADRHESVIITRRGVQYNLIRIDRIESFVNDRIKDEQAMCDHPLNKGLRGE